MRRKENTEVDILYNLLTYINASYSQDMYYTICYQVLNNIEKIPDISINELADLCYTSPATISRFCKALKCDNFAEFKKEVQVGLKQASHEIKLHPDDLVEIHQNPVHCVDMVYDLTINSLIESKKHINIHEIDRLCDIIYDAKKLHFLRSLYSSPSHMYGLMHVFIAQDLYPSQLEGDEPEPLPQVRWPLAHMMDLLEAPDFNEARNVSALFLVREWLKGQGRV